MSNFIEKCLLGEARLEDVDDFVEKWHGGDGELSLHEYLGMTKAEYSRWITDPEALLPMIDRRRTGRVSRGLSFTDENPVFRAA